MKRHNYKTIIGIGFIITSLSSMPVLMTGDYNLAIISMLTGVLSTLMLTFIFGESK